MLDRRSRSNSRAQSPSTSFRNRSTASQSATGLESGYRITADSLNSGRLLLRPVRNNVRTPTSPEIRPIRPGRNVPALRRASSRMVPLRGDKFSADDASQEIVEEEQQQQRMTLKRSNSTTLGRTTSTIRRRPLTNYPSRLYQSHEVEEDEPEPVAGALPVEPEELPELPMPVPEEAPEEAEEIVDDEEDDEEDDEADLSEAESFTLKDRQDAINDTHPFGIRLWKSALYKKNRSVDKGAEGDIHSAPGGTISGWLWFFNASWTVVFGWWLALFPFVGSLICVLLGFAPGCSEYGRVLWGLSRYLLFPFGKYVKLIQDEAYAEEDEGEGRTVTEYEQWQSGDLEQGRLFFGPIRAPLIARQDPPGRPIPADESAGLLGNRQRSDSENSTKVKRRLFGRGQWNTGRIIFFGFFYGILTPLLLLVGGICWLFIVTIPMARITFLLWDHLRRHPLALEFHSDTTDTRRSDAAPSLILVCTYRAVGTRYWKYTIDGTNIILFNLLAVVAFVVFDYWVLYVAVGLRIPLTNEIFIFLLALFSIIPLAYFIGQAVASVSAQSTMGVGAAVNAFFSTIVEVFLYCVALRQGKAQLVEGSVIGSIFAGILLLPGISMCFGALKRKTQRFNVKSAGVTSTMLLFAVICAFGPTLFYQIYGSHELNCDDCTDQDATNPLDRDCRRCYFAQIPAIDDPFYQNAVKPYTWFASVLLFVAYIIGLLFTLRTHAATIWNAELDEKKDNKMTDSISTLPPQAPAAGTKPQNTDYGTLQLTQSRTLTRQNTLGAIPRTDIRDSQLYKRILSQSLKQVDLGSQENENLDLKKSATFDDSTMPGDLAPSRSESQSYSKRAQSLRLPQLTEEDNELLVRRMAEMAATAAAVAARDATAAPRKTSQMSRTASYVSPLREVHGKSNAETIHHPVPANASMAEAEEQIATGEAAGGHDAPNWSRTKSYIVLLTATIAYAIIAEILVDTVDGILSNSNVDEKFLGLTLFALVPNTTEFLNGISFAMNGNIALSLEIGSAYALQVCLLQIPALVLFSAVNGHFITAKQVIDHTFTLIFPQWDMVTVILCVFLLSYMYGEGKSNYFKGSILILSYLVVVVGFYMAGFNTVDTLDPNDPGFKRPNMSTTRYRTMSGRRPIVIN